MKLIITEKPSVANSIANIFGIINKGNGYIECKNNYKISWCYGHLVGLYEPNDYDEKFAKWNLEQLPILPTEYKFKASKNTIEQFKVIEGLIKECETIICATDAGREGELIFRLVYDLVGIQKPIKRLWIASMEDEAIKEGFRNLRDGDEFLNLYECGKSRTIADWIVGINATRLFSVIYRNKLTIGRVQTPTLALLVNRQNEIDNFTKEKKYKVALNNNDKAIAFTEIIESKEKAEEIQKQTDNKDALCTDYKEKNKNTNPPKLYDLTTLQREANRYFSYTAQTTLNTAQTLYEKKLITYPRTDSKFITADMKNTALKLLDTIDNKFEHLKVSNRNIKSVINDKKVTDHHALLPTSKISNTNIDALNKQERNILLLIIGRLVIATSKTNKKKELTSTFDIEGVKFKGTVTTTIDNGFKDDESNLFKELGFKRKEKIEPFIEPFKKGDKLKSVTEVIESETSPPKRYTEDTLLSAMENVSKQMDDKETQNTLKESGGIGTPATRANIIEKLISTEYVVREKKNMVPTAKGMKLISIVPENLKSPLLTADWEDKLKAIEKGEYTSDEFLSGIDDFIADIIDECQDTSAMYAFNVDKSKILGKCPKCGSDFILTAKTCKCVNKKCDFTIFKEDKFFSTKRAKLTRKIVVALINGKKVKMTFYSEKKDKNYDAVISLDTSGKFARYKMEW